MLIFTLIFADVNVNNATKLANLIIRQNINHLNYIEYGF